MNKEQYRSFTAIGIRQHLLDIEKELAGLHRDWPDLFLSPTPPQLAKAILKTNGNGNGHWPAIIATPPAAVEGLDYSPVTKAIVDYLAQHGPTRADAALTAVLGTTDKGTRSALLRAMKQGRIVRVRHGTYDLPSPGSAPIPPKKKHRVTWTPAMRKAQADRMRARHAAGDIKKAKRAKAKQNKD